MRFLQWFRRTSAGQARAKAGAADLDRHFGSPQWDERINLKVLDMDSARLCVLGQLFDGYLSAPMPMIFADHKAWFGEEMARAWRDEITQRRRARAQADLEDEAEVPV